MAVQLVQQETEKLKELYHSSSKVLEKWPQSDILSFCDDKDFIDLLQNLSELDLQAAVYGLQRQLEIEVQLVKCLEHLREINSDCNDITSKLITSQVRVARLRSRLLRCVNKQLNKHGNEGVLPPWHGGICKDDRECSSVMQNMNQTISPQDPRNACSISQPDTSSHSELPNKSDNNQKGIMNAELSQTLMNAELSQSLCNPSELNWVVPNMLNSPPVNEASYLNTEVSSSEVKQESNNDLPTTGREEKEEFSAGVRIHKVGESTEGTDGMKKLQETLQKNLHEKGHDSKPVAMVIAPPKPTPYSALETMPMLDKIQAPAASSTNEQLASDEDETDGVVVKEQILMQDWDPTLLLQDLFGEIGKDEIHIQTPSEDTAALSIVRMSGYMDKLPSSYKLKKSTVFKGWKKRHFKAFDGKLFYFEDHRNKEPLGMVDLKGSSVVISAGKMLELIDCEGKAILKLRCATPVEAEDWKHAIETEAKSQQESLYEEISSDEEGSVIVIDLGSSSVKAGFAKEEAWPQVIFPCVCAVLKEDDSDCTYGFAALEPERRKTSHLRFPLRRSQKIDKLKFSPSDLTGVLEHAFSSLKADPSKHKVVMTLPQNTSADDKGALVEILLDDFNVKACYLQEQAILAMYSYSAVSGVIVDIGDHIDVIPVVEGCVIEAGASRLPYGGRQVTDMLARLLTEKGHRFFSEVESYINRYIKEQCCYVSEKEICKEKEMPSHSADIMLDKYMIPDGTRKVTLDTARYRCTEGLFDPIVWGKDHPGISHLVHKAIMACSMDVRKQMSRSMYLSGGGSMLPGFPERLQTEVCSLLPPHTLVQVHAGTDRHHAAFIGGSVVARLPLFEELCITQEEWNDNGIDALEKWHNL